jgi:6-pyruvoyltetrahydropterin/6-carboxytetrahydropterin synthase
LISVTRKYRFSASHRLHVDEFSEAENDRIFGKCNHPFGHGHDYELFVTARGPVDAETGLAVNLDRLDALVRKKVLDAFHLKYLNLDVPVFKETVPTTENVAREIERRLREYWDAAFPEGGAVFEKIRIYETERNIIEMSAK